MACAGLVLSTDPATGSVMRATVTAADEAGMATVKTEDGKESKVKGEGWKAGAKVDSKTRQGKPECKATQ
jgi:hypothetical protein